jgi:uncharacterized repeat protein (TIGR01451 family)
MTRTRIATFVVLCLAVAVGAAGGATLSHAQPVLSGPGWMVSSVAEPTNFSSADNAKCAARGPRFCDRYMVTVTNVGGSSAIGVIRPIRIIDILPAGLRLVEMSGKNFRDEQSLGCTETTCEYGGTVEPGGTIAIMVAVEVLSATGEVSNAVRVEGGGADPVATSAPSTLPNTVGGPPTGFGVADFGMQVANVGGAMDEQAADHPNDVTTILNLNSRLEEGSDGSRSVRSVQPPRDVIVTLPLGLAGNPLAASRCTAVQQTGEGGELTQCPPSSHLGNVLLFGQGIETGSIRPSAPGLSELDNLVPENGFPAEFGFKVFGKNIALYPSVIHTSSGYALRVNSPGITRTVGIEGAGLTFFGDPNTANGEPNNPQAFFTNPSDCAAGPLTAKVEADSWAEPGHWFSAKTPVYPQITGCDLLQFAPTVEMRPEVTEAEAPSGFEIKVKSPQNPNQFPVLATPDLKNVTMTLPEGMTLAPGAADGLVACPATGPNGIDMPSGDHAPDVAGEGEEIGADGLSHLTRGHCPLASQIGTAIVKTPLLDEPLEGHVYVAQPSCGGEGQPGCTGADATNGNLFGLYLEVEGSGIVIKLGGRVSVDPTTGQLTARFTELPQQPVSEVTLRLKGGVRAPLANPRQCGLAVANADFAAWGSPSVPDALWSTAYPVDWDNNRGACPATLPFAPTLSAGMQSATAAHFSTFSLGLQRGDRMQDVSRLQVTLPPGLIGMLSSVTLCKEPQATLGTCPEASEIGKTSVAVGSGSHPYVVNGGRVYLTESYKGAPFGLTIVVPGRAGPFNLGNVVVRSAINIDPSTTAITVTSDPLPQFLDGVPLRIQTLNVSVDRPGFMFNPTNCARRQISATVEAQQGASASLSSPFAVEGCNSLPFKPTFSVSTQAQTTKKGGASLKVKVTSGAGQDNIGKVVVNLPKQLPARLTTLQQACTEATFAQNPALCPAASVVGSVKAVTPVLNVPLIGPAYLVSHGGAAFPDLVIILQGQGVRLNLIGNTSIKKGITTSSFASVPDAPISSFELTLPQGPHSALAGTLPAKAKGSFCGTKLVMPTTLTAQNGARIKQSTKIAVVGCPKAKKKAKASKKTKAGRKRK